MEEGFSFDEDGADGLSGQVFRGRQINKLSKPVDCNYVLFIDFCVLLFQLVAGQ